MVATWLPKPAELAIFFAQPVCDQRHGYQAAALIQSAAPERKDLIQAGLLHDVGKRHARLGILGRSWTSFLAKLGIRPGTRGRKYLAHGAIGSLELEALNAATAAAEFARHHHDRRRPKSFDPESWAILYAADHGGKAPAIGEPTIRLTPDVV